MSPENLTKTLEQVRAETVAARVTARAKAAAKDRQAFRDAYTSRANNFGVLIRTNGLVRAVSYLAAKSGDKSVVAKAYMAFGEDFAAALTTIRSEPNAASPNALVAHLCNNNKVDTGEYMAWTREALLVAAWFKRLSVALLKGNVTAGADG